MRINFIFWILSGQALYFLFRKGEKEMETVFLKDYSNLSGQPQLYRNLIYSDFQNVR